MSSRDAGDVELLARLYIAFTGLSCTHALDPASREALMKHFQRIIVCFTIDSLACHQTKPMTSRSSPNVA